MNSTDKYGETTARHNGGWIEINKMDMGSNKDNGYNIVHKVAKMEIGRPENRQ